MFNRISLLVALAVFITMAYGIESIPTSPTTQTSHTNRSSPIFGNNAMAATGATATFAQPYPWISFSTADIASIIRREPGFVIISAAIGVISCGMSML